MKSILLASSSEEVAKALVDDLGNFGSGTLHDEMKWTDVSVHASKITNTSGNILFLTDEEIMDAPRFVEEARASGRQIITIPSTVKERLLGQVDTEGNAIQDLGHFVSEWNDCFEFKFVPPEKLLQTEKSIFDMTGRLAELVGGIPSRVQSVKVSETMRPETGSFSEACGLWTGTDIIIKRSELTSIESYASVLLHEIAHVRSGETDITIGFERELTSFLGMVATKALRTASADTKIVAISNNDSCIPEIGNTMQQLQTANSDPTPAKKAGFWARLLGNT